jgi:hypothetical protein
MLRVEKDEIIQRPIYISKNKVTRKLYCEIIGIDMDLNSNNESLPIGNISWFDSVRFCNLLSEKYGLEKFYLIDDTEVQINKCSDGFRLPFEKELVHLLITKVLTPVDVREYKVISEWCNDLIDSYERSIVTSKKIDSGVKLNSSRHNYELSEVYIGFRVIYSINN